MDAGDLDELGVGQVGEAHTMHAMKLFVEQVATLGHVLLTPLALEPLADAFLGRRALDEVEPVAARAVRTLGGEDLDDLAVLQLVVERHHAPVDLGTDATMADLGVDAVRKVDRRRVGREVQHVALGGEHIDLVLEQVDLDGVEE